MAAEFGMEWELHDTAVQPRVLIMVSKAGHCLNDLLYRRAAESLRIDVPLVVGNHPDLAPLAAAHGCRSSTCRRARRPGGRAAVRRAAARPGRRAEHRLRGAGPLHAHPVARAVRQDVRPHHQHPPLVPAQLQGSPALPPGARARGEADWRDRALRHRRPGRGPDHRAGGRPGGPLATARRTSRPSAATPSGWRSPAPCAGTPSTASCSTAAAPSSSADRDEPGR